MIPALRRAATIQSATLRRCLHGSQKIVTSVTSATLESEEWSQHQLAFSPQERAYVKALQSVLEQNKEEEEAKETTFTNKTVTATDFELPTSFSPTEQGYVKGLQAAFSNHTKQEQTRSPWLSPESVVGLPEVAKMQVEELLETDETALDQQAMDRMLLQSEFQIPESATGSIHVTEYLNSQQLQQLETSQRQKRQRQGKKAEEAMPRSMQEAMADDLAVVVTTAHPPFQVVAVNSAWEGLCGYSRTEAKHQPIGNLLQGPDTPPEQGEATRDMIKSLMRHPNQVQSIDLINYTKRSQKFHNHLQVSSIMKTPESSEQDQQPSRAEYFVGVLETVMPEGSGQQMAA